MLFDDQPLIVEDLSKCYQIYEQPVDRLKQMVLPRLSSRFSKGKTKQYYSEYWALKNVSFSVKKGETTGIIGINGAGKSTLLQLICGTLTPTSGTVNVNGRVAALLELGSGFNMDFTGVENVYLYGAVLGLQKHEMDERFVDICKFADIGEYIYQPLKTYSSGMVVRLAFAVIVHVDADILIIDEALSVGDVFFVQKCMRFLRDFIRQGTVLFVSHDIGAVVNLCSNVMWLENGRVKMEGKPKEISEQYLAALALDSQDRKMVEQKEWVSNVSVTVEADEGVDDMRDMRLSFINSTNLRNDIELFQFQPDSASYGHGKAVIVNVWMTDEQGHMLSWIVGGEKTVLVIECKAHELLRKPIIGFYIKDRLGQYLFGDNTFLTYRDSPVQVQSGQVFRATFSFRMPLLPVGDYSIATAVAEGTQDEHQQQHWLHDAFIFKSHSSATINGLVGIPMAKIELSVLQDQG